MQTVEFHIKFTALVLIIFYGLIHYPEQQQKFSTELDMKNNSLHGLLHKGLFKKKSSSRVTKAPENCVKRG